MRADSPEKKSVHKQSPRVVRGLWVTGGLKSGLGLQFPTDCAGYAEDTGAQEDQAAWLRGGLGDDEVEIDRSFEREECRRTSGDSAAEVDGSAHEVASDAGGGVTGGKIAVADAAARASCSAARDRIARTCAANAVAVEAEDIRCRAGKGKRGNRVATVVDDANQIVVATHVVRCRRIWKGSRDTSIRIEGDQDVAATVSAGTIGDVSAANAFTADAASGENGAN